MVTPQEEKAYVRDGIVSSEEELNSILETLSKVLVHKHNRRCMIPFRPKLWCGVDITGKMGSDDPMKQQFRCKYPDNHRRSPNPAVHTFVEIDVLHTDAAIEILKTIGLVGMDLDVTGRIVYLDNRLVSQRHVPPTSGGDGVMSPVLAPLHIMNPNSDNVQVLNSADVGRYLAPYAVKADKGSQIFISPPKQSNPAFVIENEVMGNTKITSVRAAENAKSQHRRQQPAGRKVPQTDVLMKIFNVPQVVTDIKFIQMQTVSLENRTGFDQALPLRQLINDGVVAGAVRRIADLDAHQVIPSQSVRQRWPLARQFKPSALVIARDQIFSPFTIDSVTVFGLRPPELLFVNRQDIYFKWFKRYNIPFATAQARKMKQHFHLVDYCKRNIQKSLSWCCWIDATSKVVKLRAAAVGLVVEYIRNAKAMDFGGVSLKSATLRLFLTFKQKLQEEELPMGVRHGRKAWEAKKLRFLCDWELEHLPVVWFNPTKPLHATRFLIHILLSMGSFENEMELFTKGSFADSFIYARLFDPAHAEESVNELTRNYVMNQLRNQAGSTPQFDRFCVSAHNILRNALLHNQIEADGMPSFLYTHLVEDTTLKTKEHIARSIQTVGQVVLQAVAGLGCKNLPTIEAIVAARTSDAEEPWDAVKSLLKGFDQTEESFLEQQAALRHACYSISQYMDVESRYCAKSILILGDPGSGKTAMMNMTVLHAMIRGLNVAMSSVQCERSLALGGQHVHLMLSLPVNKGMRPGHLADLAMRRLYRQPEKMQYLKSIDMLAFDEFGQLSAELLDVQDVILRRVRGNNNFMGGVLIVSTIDFCQLKPIEGRPPIMSPLILGNFLLARLQHSVRAAKDQGLMRIQKLSRLMPSQYTAPLIQEFEGLCLKTFTFIKDFDNPSLPPSALFVFGTRAARNLMQYHRIEKLKQLRYFRTSSSVDEEATKEGEWCSAGAPTKRKLEIICREPCNLNFFVGAMYETTFNKKDCFSNGQLVLLLELPTEDQLERFTPISVMVSPAGNKITPVYGVTVSQLLTMCWNPQTVGIAPVLTHRFAYGVTGRRQQYGLRPRVSATIHSIIGQELSCLVTRVLQTEPLYSVWEKAQVVVLLSRTPMGKQTVFVGNPVETVKALSAALTKNTQYMEYMNNLVNAMTGSEVPKIDLPSWHPYRAQDIELPKSQCVYLLVSCNKPTINYIGETKSLKRRLDEHNSGFGSLQTADNRPWGVLAYVVGFKGSASKRKEFEKEWKLARNMHLSQGKSLSANDVADLALTVIRYRKERDEHEQLTFVLAGTVTMVQPATSPDQDSLIPGAGTQASERVSPSFPHPSPGSDSIHQTAAQHDAETASVSIPDSLENNELLQATRQHNNIMPSHGRKKQQRLHHTSKIKISDGQVFETVMPTFVSLLPKILTRATVFSVSSLHELREQSAAAYSQAQSCGAIMVIPLSTNQGRVHGSINGCVGIATLVVARHLRNLTSNGITDNEIANVIDKDCVPILAATRLKHNRSIYDLLEPAEMIDVLDDLDELSTNQFVDYIGGNILDDEAILSFLELLEPDQESKAGACLLFHGHLVCILKRPLLNGTIVYDLVESLPTSNQNRTGSRTRCADQQTLRILLRWFATKSLTTRQECEYICNNRWTDGTPLQAEADPRTFQTFVWNNNNRIKRNQDVEEGGIKLISILDANSTENTNIANPTTDPTDTNIESDTSTIAIHGNVLPPTKPEAVIISVACKIKDHHKEAVLPQHGWQTPWTVVLGTGIIVRSQDLVSLSPGMFVSDVPIMHFIKKRVGDNPSVHVFDSSFYAQWLDTHSPESAFLVGNPSLTRLMERRSILSKDLWLFPINVARQHWQLIVIVDPNRHYRRIVVFDSLLGQYSNLELLKRFGMQALNTAILAFGTSNTAVPMVLVSDACFACAMAPRQDNGFDCGIFTILFAWYACLFKDELRWPRPLDFRHWFTQQNVAEMRTVFANELNCEIVARQF